MAVNSANVAKMAKHLAIVDIIIGIFLLCYGIADRIVHGGFYWERTGFLYFGVWIGIWMCVTGGLGIPASSKERTSSRNAFAGVFMGFSITSAVFGGVIIICYSIMISWMTNHVDVDEYNNNDGGYDFHTKLSILAVMLILGLVAFVVGIWASICCCMLKPCTCCTQQQGQQVMYGTANPTAAGFVMAQLSGGFPVAIPVHTSGIMVAAEDVRPPMVLVPVSDASEEQPLIATGGLQQQVQPQVVQIGPPNAISGICSSPQQVEIPDLYAHVGHIPLQNKQIQVKT